MRLKAMPQRPATYSLCLSSPEVKSSFPIIMAICKATSATLKWFDTSACKSMKKMAAAATFTHATPG